MTSFLSMSLMLELQIYPLASASVIKSLWHAHTSYNSLKILNFTYQRNI